MTVGFGLPAFVATLGMFYIARGIAAWLVAGQQLTGFPESFNLIGRKLDRRARAISTSRPRRARLLCDLADGAQRAEHLHGGAVAIVAGVVLGYTPVRASRSMPPAATVRAADYAGINTNRVRFVEPGLLRRSAPPSPASSTSPSTAASTRPPASSASSTASPSVIIGGGSIFGGYGTVIGSLAGAAVITLVRALLSLQIIRSDGTSFVMPQHWVNVFIGLILIVAVLIDIWVRQANIFGTAARSRHRRGRSRQTEAAHA